MAAKDVTSAVKRGLHELTKQYFVYDANARMIEVYDAATDAAQGDPCLKTTYQYAVGTVRVIKMKEDLATWDSTYD